MMKTLFPPARPRAAQVLAATTFLLAALVGTVASEASIHSSTALSLPDVDSDEACQFAIRADNDIGEDVWILFTGSQVIMQRANFFSTEFKDMANRRLAPGEKLNARFEAPGACGAPRFWGMTVRIGGRGGEVISVWRETEGSTDRTVHLGAAACWAGAESPWWEDADEDRVVRTDDEAVGCDPSTTRYGLAPEPDEEDPGGGAEDDTPSEAVESISIGSLQGNWRRADSNNDRNDGMRALVQGGQATLMHIPQGGSRRFQEGNVLWQEISADGSLDVRGSDGRYYSARLSFEGEDRIHIDIDSNGPGNDQTWDRAGPTIDGEWVLAASTDGENEGLRVEVRQDRATLLYLPASTSVPFRVGDLVWREIGPETLEALNRSRDYVGSGYRLAAGDQLRVETDGVTQVWVRPGAEDGIDASDLTGGGAGGGDRGDGGGGGDPADPGACVATGLVGEVMGVNWGWGLTDSDPDPGSILSALPAWEAPSNPDSRRVIDVDRSRVDGLDDHYALIWEADTGGLDWEEERDLTGSAFMARNEAHRGRGLRLTDLEVDVVDGQTLLAGIWTENVEGIDWDLDPVVDPEVVDRIARTRATEGYRLVDIEAHERGSQMALSVVWHRSCTGAAWAHVANVDRDTYQDSLDAATARGLQPIDIESWMTPAGQRYAAIFEASPAGRDFRARSGRDLQGFINYHRRYVDQGFRLIDYESYETAEGSRYSGIWVENDERWRDPIRPVLDTLIQTFQDSTYVPGMSVVVIENGDVVYRRGFGDADRDRDTWAWSGTVYLLASVSKVVGGTLAARLEEQLGPDFDLSKKTAEYLVPAADYADLPSGTKTACDVTRVWYCQDLPDRHTHTVEQLLSKTGCVPHYNDTLPTPPPNGIDYTPAEKYYVWRAQALTEVWDNPLVPGCVPGTNYRYSTPGFSFVGAVLESQTGKDIATLIEDEIATPLGLTTLRAMVTSDGVRPDYDRAEPYELAQTGRDPNGNPDTLWTRAHPTNNPTNDAQYDDPSWKVLGGGIEADAMDLARFGWGALDGQLVADPSRMWTSLTSGLTTMGGGAAPSVGLAWNLNGTIAEHGGSWAGSGTHLLLETAQDVVVSIVSNRRRAQMVRYGSGGHSVRGLGTLADEILAVVLSR